MNNQNIDNSECFGVKFNKLYILLMNHEQNTCKKNSRHENKIQYKDKKKV
jgi:hypothetical protein